MYVITYLLILFTTYTSLKLFLHCTKLAVIVFKTSINISI